MDNTNKRIKNILKKDFRRAIFLFSKITGKGIISILNYINNNNLFERRLSKSEDFHKHKHICVVCKKEFVTFSINHKNKKTCSDMCFKELLSIQSKSVDRSYNRNPKKIKKAVKTFRNKYDNDPAFRDNFLIKCVYENVKKKKIKDKNGLSSYDRWFTKIKETSIKKTGGYLKKMVIKKNIRNTLEK